MNRMNAFGLRPPVIRASIVALVIALLVAAAGLAILPADASQQSLADHPLVGTWIVDPEDNTPTNPPSFDAFMADGTLVNIGSDGASVGSWEATGPRTASITFAGLVENQPGAAFIIRANLEVDESGQTFTATHSFTLIAADGSVLAAFEGGGGSGVRLEAEPAESVGQSLPGLPIWVPASPEAATPAT